jgi:hypothetical protein
MTATEWPWMRVAVPAITAIAGGVAFVTDGPRAALFWAAVWAGIGIVTWVFAWAASNGRSVGGESA